MTQLSIKRALLSVSNKAGLLPLARFLAEQKVELISTGGTAEVLKAASIPFTPIEKITGNAEAFGGRMKTISFEIGSALLFRRDDESDQAHAKSLGISAIDLVVCNLYPFADVAKTNASLPELIEQIDIGGPTMIRAAAKNFASVAVLTKPEQYEILMAEMKNNDGVSRECRERLALEAFHLITSYDLTISKELALRMGHPLRYGENPHQKAVLIPLSNTSSETPLAQATVLQGKEISYNNFLDADHAFKACSEISSQQFKKSTCVIVKHGTPCGVATHDDQLAALTLAWQADPVSAFGGIIAFDSEVKEEAARFLSEYFAEVIIAPGYTEEALQIFKAKKNLRVLITPLKKSNEGEWTLRSIHGGILVQDEDEAMSPSFDCVTRKQWPNALLPLARFGLSVTKSLKSNCIGTFAEKENGLVTLASGVGQPNRLDCISKLIAPKLKDQASLQDTVLVSDAFFPFRDSIDAAAELGVKWVVQPGGSIKDKEVIAACDERGIGMLLTGQRHFRH